MKRFIWFLILCAAVYFGWKYYPEIKRLAIEYTSSSSSKPADDKASSVVRKDDGAKKETVIQPKFPDRPIPNSEADIEARYPMPSFRPIEVLTGGWFAIPPTAFPRETTLKKPLVCKIAGGAGTARIDAGTKVLAVAAQNGVLTLKRGADSDLSGQLPIDETDFEDVLNAVYERFKERQRNAVLKQREQALAQVKKSAGSKNTGASLDSLLNSPGEDPPAAVISQIGPRPPQNSDHSVPAMLSSISSGQVKDFKLADIKSWGPVHSYEFEGQPYWTAGVRYTARTIFGEFPTEALALMRHNRVVKWVYAGTGEPVP